MTLARQPADRDRVRAAARSRNGSRARAAQAGGEIEAIPLPGGSVDVPNSNCVINLPVGRPAVFAGCFHVLRRDGLTRAGFTGISSTATRQAGDGVHSAIIRAARP